MKIEQVFLYVRHAMDEWINGHDSGRLKPSGTVTQMLLVTSAVYSLHMNSNNGERLEEFRRSENRDLYGGEELP
ncbi:2811_t:CDS:2 [Gigaspora margarita]|nr:2811_t:CDS:2 [Gigaspora margarita]